MKTVLHLFFFLFLSASLFAQSPVDYGKSYVNITKGTAGGTNEPGDILEIRATFVVMSGTVYKCGYVDSVPVGTTYIPGTLRVLTNEGKIYQQFTDASDSDPGSIAGITIRMNLGRSATAAGGGTIRNTYKPSVGGNSCIMVASYRVKINAAIPYGSTVNVGRGTFYYARSSSGAQINVPFAPDLIMVYQNYGICPNSIGGNAILSEYGGTFGSGILKDRGPSIKVPSNYTYVQFNANGPNDYYYGVTNNTSPGGYYYNMDNTWTIPDPHRVFSTWEVIGDHTGAADPYLGNPATDTTQGPGGYMVVINASYRTDTAFKDVITNLCPDTYYQYTAWLRNIGPKGGSDSNAVGAIDGNSSYIPTGPGDSSGVHPNLTFNANGYDYYTTGDIPYTGRWVQKGFTFKTGPAQTSMTIYIRNNAPGGGGNDWAIDDISVASCSPNLILTPAKPDTVCQGQVDSVGFRVSSFFSEYSYWQVEQSFDGGTTWAVAGSDTTGTASNGNGNPVYNPSTGQYEYNVKRYYKLDKIHTLILFRIRVASSAANLISGSCSFSATTSKVVHGFNCDIVLPVSILAFNGRLQDGWANLKWTTGNETAGTKYTIERSRDGNQFEAAGTVGGQGGAGGGSSYTFTDPQAVRGPVWYRIRVSDGSLVLYSQVIHLDSSGPVAGIGSLVNPFVRDIRFELTMDADARADMSLLDAYGRVVRRQVQAVSKGSNMVVIPDLEAVAAGMYVLQVRAGGRVFARTIVKTERK